jgi:hypothetical protein
MHGSELTALSQTIKESTMSDSLVLVHSRSNELHIVDPDAIPHCDELSPLLLLAVEVIRAGHKGVAIDELKLKNGRFVYSLEGDLATPEGVVMQKLSTELDEGCPMPNAANVLEAIRRIYERREGQEPLQQSKNEENSK